MMYRGWPIFGHMGGWGFGGIIAGAVFWVLLILFIIILVSGLSRKSHDDKQDSDSALKILKERYARGEIDRDEFNKMKKEIA